LRVHRKFTRAHAYWLELNFRLLKNRASRQEKAASCNRNGAASDEHIFNLGSIQGGARVYTAWAPHLDALFKDGGRAAGNGTVPHQVGDCASGG
jgi:hypothetical protein